MQTILSLLIFVVLTYWVGQIYFGKKKLRMVEYSKGEHYLLSPNMYFVIFTVCTAPIFLGSLALLKYGLWFMTMLALLFVGKVRMKFEFMTVMYSLFFLWLCYTMTYTTVPRDGAMMLIKYFLPMLFLWLGYSGLWNEKDLIISLKVVNIAACVYCLFIGGQGCKLLPWLYYGPIGGQFLRYAGFADFLTSIFIVPIMLYWLSKEKKYIYCALWMVLSTVLESVRTGMGGMLLAFCIALLLKNKAKAIPGLAVAGALFLGVVLFVPSVNEKFFGEDAGTISATDIVQGDALSQENINTSGRLGTWEMIMEKIYKGHEVLGSGLGMSTAYLKHLHETTGTIALLHNDYVQIISDTGIVGIVLIILFYIAIMLKGITYVIVKRSSPCVKITGIMAVSSLAGIAFSMFYDNVVSHSMSSLVMPFIFLGFFLKSIDLDANKQLSK